MEKADGHSNEKPTCEITLSREEFIERFVGFDNEGKLKDENKVDLVVEVKDEEGLSHFYHIDHVYLIRSWELPQNEPDHVTGQIKGTSKMIVLWGKENGIDISPERIFLNEGNNSNHKGPSLNGNNLISLVKNILQIK